DLLRLLVAGDVPGAEVEQLPRLDLPSGAEGDDGPDRLAELVVGNTEDGDLGDGVVAGDHLLHLPRMDVQAAGDDLVVLAVDEVDVALVVHPRQIAGGEGAVAEGLRGLFRPLPVAVEQVGRTD